MKIKTLWIVLAAVAVLIVPLLIFGGYAAVKYNTLVADSNEVENAWGKVQTAYQRRSDLVPNLVSTVKGAAAHEANTLQAVTDAREGGNCQHHRRPADRGELEEVPAGAK